MRPSVPTVDPSWQERRRALAAAGTAQVFDFEKWAKHRSLWKYWIAVRTLPTSHVLRSCAVPVLWVAFVSILVGLKDELEEAGAIPTWFRVERFTEIVQEPLTITSFALSLLLVFRTNSSYARFNEARALWGMVLNRSRDLTRQCVSFYPTSEWDAKATFARWTISFSKCLLCHLRPFSSLRDEVSHVLSKEEIQILLAADHPTVMCIQVLSELIEAAPITAIQRWQMHENLTKLEDMLGACERILKTPIPLAYSRHTHRFLIIWLTILPYALWATFDWATVAVAPLISLFLSGINEIGIDVEEPFSLLPLAAIADTALKNCTQIVNMQLLLADRLIEARDKSLNGRVFNVVQDERDTKLAREQADLLPLSRRSAMSMLEQVTSASTGTNGLARPSAMPRLPSAGFARPSAAGPARSAGVAASAPRPPLQRHSATPGVLRPVPERPQLQRHSAMSSFNNGAATAAAAVAAAAHPAASAPTAITPPPSDSTTNPAATAIAPHTNTDSPFKELELKVPAIHGSAVPVESTETEEEEPPAATPSVATVPWPGGRSPRSPTQPSSPTSPPLSVRSAFAALPPHSPHAEQLSGMHHVSSMPQAYVDPGDARLRFYGRGADDEASFLAPGGFRIDSDVRGVSTRGSWRGSGRRLSLESAPPRRPRGQESLFVRARRRGAAFAENIRQRARSQDP